MRSYYKNIYFSKKSKIGHGGPTQNWIMRTSVGPKWQNFRKLFSFSINGWICYIVKYALWFFCAASTLPGIYYFYHFLFLQVNSILRILKFSNFFFNRAGPESKRYARTKDQTKDQKTPKTRWKRFYFRNGLGTVPGVYEATTIAHRTPPALAVTTVGGTCGVLKTSFWPNIASSLPTSSWPW